MPLFHPSRREVRDMRERLTKETRIKCGLDAKERPMHCHHEKTIVIDDRVAFVGGIDLTSFQGDRWDTSGHRARARLGWHDATSKLEGPAVADVADHFRLRWNELTGEQLDAPGMPGAAGAHTVQVVRTISDGMYDRVPHGEFRILESYVRALRSARELIYIENQFLWAPEIVSVLAEKLRTPPAWLFTPPATLFDSRSPTPMTGPANGVRSEGFVPAGTASSRQVRSRGLLRLAAGIEKEPPEPTATFFFTVMCLSPK